MKRNVRSALLSLSFLCAFGIAHAMEPASDSVTPLVLRPAPRDKAFEELCHEVDRFLAQPQLAGGGHLMGAVDYAWKSMLKRQMIQARYEIGCVHKKIVYSRIMTVVVGFLGAAGMGALYALNTLICNCGNQPYPTPSWQDVCQFCANVTGSTAN